MLVRRCAQVDDINTWVFEQVFEVTRRETVAVLHGEGMSFFLLKATDSGKLSGVGHTADPFGVQASDTRADQANTQRPGR
jgi:hypothetical protein